MSDDVSQGTGSPTGTGENPPENAPDAGADRQQEWDGNIDSLPGPAQEYIKKLRAEAAANRVKAKEEEAARIKREQEALAEQGKWKELAESRAKEVERLQAVQDELDSTKAIIEASNKARIERIPEDMRSLVPVDYLSPRDLAKWLDANESRLTKPAAPNLDAGAGVSGGGGQVRLTEDQRNLARALGISEEKMIEQIKRENQRGE